MINKIVMQKAKVEDARIIAEIHTITWQKAYSDILDEEYLSSLNIEKSEIMHKIAFKKNQEDTYLAGIDEEIVGFITLGANRDNDLTDDTGEIWAIYISPKHWRKGYGKSMFDWAFSEMRKRGFSNLALWAFENNESGDAFYKHMGFVKDGLEKSIPKFGEQKIVRYRKDIK